MQTVVIREEEIDAGIRRARKVDRVRRRNPVAGANPGISVGVSGVKEINSI